MAGYRLVRELETDDRGVYRPGRVFVVTDARWVIALVVGRYRTGQAVRRRARRLVRVSIM